MSMLRVLFVVPNPFPTILLVQYSSSYGTQVAITAVQVYHTSRQEMDFEFDASHVLENAPTRVGVMATAIHSVPQQLVVRVGRRVYCDP